MSHTDGSVVSSELAVEERLIDGWHAAAEVLSHTSFGNSRPAH